MFLGKSNMRDSSKFHLRRYIPQLLQSLSLPAILFSKLVYFLFVYVALSIPSLFFGVLSNLFGPYLYSALVFVQNVAKKPVSLASTVSKKNDFHFSASASTKT